MTTNEPNDPANPPKADETPRRGHRALEIIESKRRTYRRIRILSLFLMLSALALGGLAMIGEQGMVHQSQIEIAPLSDDAYVIGLRRQDSWRSRVGFKIGHLVPDKSPVWSPGWNGKLVSIETMADGSTVAFVGDESLVFPPLSEDGKLLRESDPTRLIAPRTRGSVSIPAVIGNRVMHAYIDAKGLHVAPAFRKDESTEVAVTSGPIAKGEDKPADDAKPTGDTPEALTDEPAKPLGVLDPGGHWIPVGTKIDGIPADVSMAAYHAIDDVHHVLLLEKSPTTGGSGGKFVVVSFRLAESFEPMDFGLKPTLRESAGAAGTVEAATSNTDAPSSNDRTSTVEAPNAAETPSASAPDTKPASTDSLNVNDGPAMPMQMRIVRPVDVKTYQFSTKANRFWSGHGPDGLVVAWREIGSEARGTWQATVGRANHYVEPFAIRPNNTTLPERPLMAPCRGGIELLLASDKVDVLERHRLMLIGPSAGEWFEADAIPLERSNLPLPVETLLMLMIFAGCAGLMGIAWLNVNRTRDAEVALSELVKKRTGRDTTMALASKLLETDKIQWATLTRRAFAFLIDFVAIAPIVILVSDQAGIDVDKALNLYPLRQEYLLEGLGERLMTLGVFGVYAFTCETIWGRTLGKMVLGLRVVTTRGMRPSVVALFVRNVLRVAELAAPLTMVVALGALVFTRRNQRLGDLMGGTGISHEVQEDDDDSLPTEMDR